jgi:tetratricopeptide (TPR) repeat protein
MVTTVELIETSLVSTIRLNNLGIRFFESGSYREAVDVLKSGMTNLRRLIEDYIHSTTEAERELQQQGPSGLEASLSSLGTADCSATGELKSDSGSASSLYTFKRPLRITSELVSFPNSYAELSLIMTYNLGLVYHEIGSIADDADRLRKAFSLYNMTLDILLRDQIVKSSTLIVLAAILNNMGVIQAKLGDIDLCKMFFRRLLSVLMIELATRRDSALVCSLEGFFYNINHFLYEKPSAAAA